MDPVEIQVVLDCQENDPDLEKLVLVGQAAGVGPVALGAALEVALEVVGVLDSHDLAKEVAVVVAEPEEAVPVPVLEVVAEAAEPVEAVPVRAFVVEAAVVAAEPKVAVPELAPEVAVPEEVVLGLAFVAVALAVVDIVLVGFEVELVEDLVVVQQPHSHEVLL